MTPLSTFWSCFCFVFLTFTGNLVTCYQGFILKRTVEPAQTFQYDRDTNLPFGDDKGEGKRLLCLCTRSVDPNKRQALRMPTKCDRSASTWKPKLPAFAAWRRTLSNVSFCCTVMTTPRRHLQDTVTWIIKFKVTWLMISLLVPSLCFKEIKFVLQSKRKRR